MSGEQPGPADKGPTVVTLEAAGPAASGGSPVIGKFRKEGTAAVAGSRDRGRAPERAPVKPLSEARIAQNHHNSRPADAPTLWWGMEASRKSKIIEEILSGRGRWKRWRRETTRSCSCPPPECDVT